MVASELFISLRFISLVDQPRGEWYSGVLQVCTYHDEMRGRLGMAIGDSTCDVSKTDFLGEGKS